ncbi:RING/U-box superfamily protein [Rhynchospora pubera]|uniref:RING-type E3 ubiquitin transferase n=1 Tax=Rhynchospora pubera TaxID=906938 RepID=A0AAV8FDR3_9POAL|nr:RING/U-box superfamily protein [Rhynchospora pubera]
MSSYNPAFSDNSNNYTTQNLLILSGVSFGFIIVLIAIAILCERFYCRRWNQNTAVVPDAPRSHNTVYGLSPSTIAHLPTFGYKRYDNEGSGGGGWLQCAVCLSMVQEGEEVRQVPICKHMFHQECIDMWFYSHSTCPLCRTKVEGPEEVKVRDNQYYNSPGITSVNM